MSSVQEQQIDKKTLRLTCVCGQTKDCKLVIENGERRRSGYMEFLREHAKCGEKGSDK